jgi:hypothetical protein
VRAIIAPRSIVEGERDSGRLVGKPEAILRRTAAYPTRELNSDDWRKIAITPTIVPYPGLLVKLPVYNS